MRVVIIGYGMAGSRLAAELRDRGPDMKITVLGAERHRAYNRIMLSSVLAGKVRERDVEITEAAGHGIDLRPGVTVTAIDRAARTLTTDNGEQIEYDHLVLATGSRAIIPPLGIDANDLPDRVAVFRTLDDCRRILATASEARSALVLGGGLLGLEAARGLAARGLDTQVVHAVGHLMERQLDPAASAVLVRTLSSLGITAHLDAMAASVSADAGGVTLGLAGGRELRADLLVVACGVRPETGLAGTAGLTVERGIVVDDRMRTSDPAISAIGDCAQHEGVVSGLVAPAWEQARIVARVLSGGDPLARYRPLPVVTRLKAAGIDLAAMGTSAPTDGAEELSFADPVRGTYAKLTIVGERLTGAIMLGDNPAVGTVIQLFDRGTPVPVDRRALLLGRAIGIPAATQAESPALMPDAATVCQCNTVTKGTLVRCWRAGARSVDDVVAATRATTGCGTCRDAVEGIVDWLSTVDSAEVAA
ncbi:FAD-dependent oxidoreductase [Phytohabitans rumicis]|uniref:FAD/NAD(P)-binding oxidoreductase n=1 Tax=Phytohabitans rumicis TaxID=1076125 RepID=A0A6V8KXG4_9ACTN|nr:FAD-dependent oxidoreductase [Phytohabitans rumicis]GFJ89763.1 FAD/NAD(P)-binding oxidoreductase [Phytohabitans rumicis]